MFSDLFNTVFVHIPKTGGQSVEQVFLRMHGRDWATRDALLLRKRNPSEKGSLHLAHLYAREYVEFGFLSRNTFASCFKFSTVRDPYDRLLSLYRYRATRRQIGYRDFVELMSRSGRDRDLDPQSNFVLDHSGQIAVDRIVRFELLQTEFAAISREVFGRSIELPHRNKSRTPVPPDALDEELRTAIHKHYECDFDLFNYPSGRKYHNLTPLNSGAR